MAGDWLRLYRKSLDSRVFSDDWLWRLWCWCLMQACWKTTWKDGREIQPGQFTLGRNEAADRLKVSPSKLYRGLHTLRDWGQIRLEANSRFTTVTICNWRTYQPCDSEEWTAGEQPVNSRRTADEQPMNTPLIREEGKKERPPPTPSTAGRGRAIDSLDPFFNRFWKAYPKHDAKIDAQRAWDELQVDDALLEEILKAIAAQRQSDKWKRGVIMNAGNWLREQRWRDRGIVGMEAEPLEEKNARILRDQKKEAEHAAKCIPREDAVAKLQKLKRPIGAPDES